MKSELRKGPALFSHLFAMTWRSLGLACFLLADPTGARGQELHFEFDARGNLIVQEPPTGGLPVILAQPQPQVVAPGALASFFVIVSDPRNLGYQWRFNGANITGATSDALLIQNAGATNEGLYSVVISKNSEEVTSAPAPLNLDSDGDGLPDSWELTYFGNRSSTNTATGDFDGDGVSNLDELHDGTSPADKRSANFRLTLLSDGGIVEAAPAKLTYAYGEIVTLTATPISPNTFHGWTGDTNSFANPITLTMTTNVTVFAHQNALDFVWTNSASGDWNAAGNWDPNFVPSSNDTVTLAKNGIIVTVSHPTECRALTLVSSTLTVAEGGSLVLSTMDLNSGNLGGGGVVTVSQQIHWTGGTMSGRGRTIILPGASLGIAPVAATVLLGSGRTLENGGTILWTAGNFGMNAAVITNRPGAVFEIQTTTGLNYASSPGSRFDNAGLVRKSVNPGTATLSGGLAFNNYNAVEVQIGTLSLLGGGAHSGRFDIAAGAALRLAGGTHLASRESSITGAGSLTVAGGAATLAGLVNVTGTNTFGTGTASVTGNYVSTNNTWVIAGGTVNFDGTGLLNPAVVMQSGNLGGRQTVAIAGEMTWTSGAMSGSGRTIILPGATLRIAPVAATVSLGSGRTLENGGTILWTAGNFGMNGAVITNRPGAVFEIQTTTGLNYASSPGSRFDNAGLVRKSVNPGTASLFGGLAFNNYHTVEIQSGILVVNGGFNSTPSSLLSLIIGGPEPGTGYGRLQVGGSVVLNGSLQIALASTYQPNSGDTFTVLTAGVRNGVFSNFYFPSPVVSMQLSNTPSSVIVRVGEVPSLAPPFLLAPELAGTDLRLIWTASSNATYRLEISSDLNPTNWVALPGDILGLGQTAGRSDSLTTSNRFYRVRVVP